MAPFVTWAEGLSTETVGKDLFWPKTGLNLSEDLFYGLHLILGRKTDLVLGWKIFVLVSINLKFSAPPLPPFENSAYATEFEGYLLQYLKLLR